MPIKSIQLRGISRLPSDRMTEDGGVAESLNLHIEDNENAPTMAPNDIIGTTVVDGADKLPQGNYEVLYIHKMASLQLFICLEENGQNERIVAYGIDNPVIMELQGERIDSITSVGNTLVMTLDGDYVCAIFKDDRYKVLEGGIPIPGITFYQTEAHETKGFSGDLDEPIDQKELNGNSSNNYKLTSDKGRTALAQILEKISDTPGRRMPVALRFAVRLYDGTHTRISVPYLFGIDRDLLTVRLEQYGSQQGTVINVMHFFGSIAGYGVEYTLDDVSDFNGWEDIVQSIDIFASNPIPGWIDNDASSMKADTWIDDEQVTHHDYLLTVDPYNTKDHPENMIETLTQFHLVRSIPVSEFVEMEERTSIAIDDRIWNGEWLGSRETLQEGFMDNHDLKPSRLISYNARVLAFDVRRVLSTGFIDIPSMVYKNVTTNYTYLFKYSVSTSSGVKTFYGKTGTGSSTFYLMTKTLPYGWLAYPDSRCTSVEVILQESDGYYIGKLQMNDHPFLNIAYAFLGFGVGINDWLRNEGEYHTGKYTRTSTTDREENLDNKLYQSESSNPFQFTAMGTQTLAYPIIDVATTTKALSAGQYGQFPLYVFTKGGVWVIGLNTDGSFGNITPLSRDVAKSHESVIPIDQAIVFTTDKGVMLLTQSDITNISPFMNGVHYTLDDEYMKTSVRGFGMGDQIPALTDSASFMKFMAEAQGAYDYTGDRIIFFREDSPYQYVYQIGTRTWHKTTTLGYSPRRALNSYPVCLIDSKGSDNKAHLLNFSTPLDLEDSRTNEERQCVIVTRPFDLDNPDVLKTINHIHVRGNYQRHDNNGRPRVAYMLQGSMDGHTFHRLGSLRGKSWKMFRIILLAKIKPTERISWIDVDYETRFTNKLR